MSDMQRHYTETDPARGVHNRSTGYIADVRYDVDRRTIRRWIARATPVRTTGLDPDEMVDIGTCAHRLIATTRSD
jgi:hypothetical protein